MNLECLDKANPIPLKQTVNNRLKIEDRKELVELYIMVLPMTISIKILDLIVLLRLYKRGVKM